ncbi:MgtC/SapB family protein [Methylobacterium dankookense]|uniref:Protein MgtC n=1 Tax=Methylobacterium dankookense TaxID=560405 RepID=A0A564FSJ5_9HYPH|nr:MgtC/SapB family protein [Methylobacterium dankookense]GJD56880.1 hypothetical protein IFDJLNFL_2778 [Methylobacterium dankookense]VUF10716.1 hypothetical protein MTDSW087_00387 [Methylobacterium dankookense]
MTTDLGLDTLLVRLGLGLVAGALLGWNREELGHPAGLRTMVLICLAACTAMLLANWLLAHTETPDTTVLRLDLMRLAQGVLAGIGFIGAGTILKQGSIVRGVTTAATVWLATVVGLCFGAGAWQLGMAATAGGLVVLQGLKWVEARLRRRSYGSVTVVFDAGQTSHATLLAVIEAQGFSLRSARFEQDGNRGRLRGLGAHRACGPAWSLALIAALRSTPGVERVAWEDAA